MLNKNAILLFTISQACAGRKSRANSASTNSSIRIQSTDRESNFSDISTTSNATWKSKEGEEKTLVELVQDQGWHSTDYLDHLISKRKISDSAEFDKKIWEKIHEPTSGLEQNINRKNYLNYVSY